jgi:hypothetical protein
MARYTLASQSVTLTAVADTANFTSAGFPFVLQGGGSTQALRINEVQCGGESTSSATAIMVFARDTTAAATFSGCTLALMDATSTAPGTVPAYGNTITTKSQRSATAHLLQHSFNAFGGLVRWQARQGEEITTYGATEPLGEVSYSANTNGAGIVSSHCIFEVV